MLSVRLSYVRSLKGISFAPVFCDNGSFLIAERGLTHGKETRQHWFKNQSDYAFWPANTADATAARVTVIITVSNEITTTQTILLQQSWQLAYHYGHLRHQSTGVVSVCCTPDLTWLVRFSATRPIATNTRPLVPYPLPIPHVQVSRYLLLVWLVSNKDNSNDKQINLSLSAVFLLLMSHFLNRSLSTSHAWESAAF